VASVERLSCDIGRESAPIPFAHEQFPSKTRTSNDYFLGIQIARDSVGRGDRIPSALLVVWVTDGGKSLQNPFLPRSCRLTVWWHSFPRNCVCETNPALVYDNNVWEHCFVSMWKLPQAKCSCVPTTWCYSCHLILRPLCRYLIGWISPS